MADSVGNGFPSTGIQKGHLFYDTDDQLWQYINGNPILVESWRLLLGRLASDPDTSTWGLIQAGAMWFNQPQGILKVWTGSIVFPVTTGVISPLYNYKNSIVFQEDFISASITQSVIGISGMFTTGGSSSSIAMGSLTDNRPGVIRRDTSAVINTVAAMLLSSNQSMFSLGITIDLLWICRANNNDADTIMRIGMGNTMTVNPVIGSGALFEKLGADANWFATLYAGGVATRVDTGIAVDLNFHKFRIIQNTTVSYLFYIDDVLVATMTTGMPTVGMQPATCIVNGAAASKTLDHDYLEFVLTGISRN